MSYQCKLPCLPPSACVGEAAHTDTCPSHCAVVDLDPCLVRDVHLCPEQTCQVDHCLCQGAATCPDSCPQVGATYPPFAVPVPGEACTPPCVNSCVGACVTPAATPCETHQSKGGTSFPFQVTDSPVELCTPETAETCVENFPLQHAILPVDPSNPDEAEPCVPQSTTEPMGTCPPQSTTGPADTSSTKGRTKGAGAPLYARAPFCLNTRTPTIVERCLHRCQMWLRGKK